jgi:hypothetical protein
MRRITIMSGPIKFRILAIVIGIKNLGYVCFVRKLCCVQSIHTELAELYSRKLIVRRCALWALGDLSSICQACLVKKWNRERTRSVLLNGKDKCMNRVIAVTIALSVCRF